MKQRTIGPLLISDWLNGNITPDGPPERGLEWAGYDLPIPGHWISGAYIAMFVEGDENGSELATDPPLNRSTVDAQQGKALIVVMNPQPGSSTLILYKLPYFTYQAYNQEGTPPANFVQLVQLEPSDDAAARRRRRVSQWSLRSVVRRLGRTF